MRAGQSAWPSRWRKVLAGFVLLFALVSGCRRGRDEEKKRGEQEVQQLLDYLEAREKRGVELRKAHPDWSTEDIESELWVQEGLRDKVRGTVDDICLAYRVVQTSGNRKEQADWTMSKVFEVWGRVTRVEESSNASQVTLAGNEQSGRCRIHVTFAKQPGFRFDATPGTWVGARCSGFASMDDQGVLSLGPLVIGAGEPVAGSCRRLQ